MDGKLKRGDPKQFKSAMLPTAIGVLWEARARHIERMKAQYPGEVPQHARFKFDSWTLSRLLLGATTISGHRKAAKWSRAFDGVAEYLIEEMWMNAIVEKDALGWAYFSDERQPREG